jgi:hypothetical protein
VTADKIDPSDGDSNDEPDAAGGDSDSDQIVLTITARVKGTFSGGASIPVLHDFSNHADLYWYDKPSGSPDRKRLSRRTNEVVHSLAPTGIVLEPNHTDSAEPGTVREYRHLVRNFNSAAVSVRFDYGPSSEGWDWILYKVENDGSLTRIPSGNSINLGANGGTADLVARAFVPIDTPAGTTDVLTITATGPDNTVSVADVTLVQSTRVRVTKDISLDGSSFARELDVEREQEVWQRLSFVVDGTEPVKDVTVNDFIPEYTSYVAGSWVDDADYTMAYSTDGGVTYTAGDPTGSAAAEVTNLRWVYVGNGGELEPGVAQQILFKVRIE